MPTNNREHAVVLGAGIAGLLCARVLADSYTKVTIVERDRFEADPVRLDPIEPDLIEQDQIGQHHEDHPGPRPSHRRGTPQSRHVHGVLPRGLTAIEELLPGATERFIAAGGLVGDILANTRWYLNGRLLRQAPTGLRAISASRPLIEGVLRSMVCARPNVAMLDGFDVVGLRRPDPGRMTGVRVSSPHTETSRVLPADLVVDTTGRGTRTPRWLEEWGYPAPAEERVGIDLRYVSRRFAVPPEVFGDTMVAVTARFPGQTRSSVMQRLEDGSVLVTLAGVLGERPPTDLEAAIAYAATLAAPMTHEVMQVGRPLDEPVAFHCPTYVRRRYELLTDFPDGLLVAGDAICNFNPVYGQGMTVAAVSAQLLATELNTAGDGRVDPYRYFGAVAQMHSSAWGLSVGADLALDGVTGPALPRSPLTPEYLGRLQLAAADDAHLAEALLRVTSLIDPLPSLLHPDLVARVDAARRSPV